MGIERQTRGGERWESLGIGLGSGVEADHECSSYYLRWP